MAYKINGDLEIYADNRSYGALKNISDKAPTSHASSGTTYGVGSGSNYGHCKTINNLTTSSYADGNALAAYQGYLLNQNKQDKPTNLYNNTSGSTGTITLSQTSANFAYIEILYGKKSAIDNVIKYNSVRIYSPNGKEALLSLYFRATSNLLQHIGAAISISGTTITKKYYYMINSTTNGGGAVDCSLNDNSILIFRVDGYK